MALQDDNEIMEAVQNGEVRRLSVLFERHHRALFHFFVHLTARKELSEDLVQEVFYRILKSRHTYRPGMPFASWMYQVARNAHIDHLRKKRNEAYSLDGGGASGEEVFPEPVEPTPHPEQSLQQRQEVELLRRAMAELPADKRELLVLSRFQNLKYEEIARILGVEVNTVKVRIFRAVRQLGAVYQTLAGERA